MMANLTGSSQITVEFSASAPRSAFERSLDEVFPTAARPGSCLELDPGAHLFEVWATDQAGCAGAASAVHTWTIDQRAARAGARAG